MNSRTSAHSPAARSDRLIDALVQTSFATMAVLNRVGGENDLSLTQLRVLAILRDRRVRMTALADHLGLEKSTMTGLVDRAEKRGLLQRARNSNDGRAVDVLLTPAGAQLTERVYAEVERLLAPSTNALEEADRKQFQLLLERMLAG